MKFISLHLALQTAIMAVVFTAAGHGEDKGTAAVSAQDLRAKIEPDYPDTSSEPDQSVAI